MIHEVGDYVKFVYTSTSGEKRTKRGSIKEIDSQFGSVTYYHIQTAMICYVMSYEDILYNFTNLDEFVAEVMNL